MYGKLLIILSIAGLLSCDDDAVNPEIGEEIKIPFQRTIRVQDSELGTTIDLHYAQLMENSICRPNQICIWQGRLVVRVQLDEATRILGLGDNFSLEQDSIHNSETYSHYEIELLGGNQDFIKIQIQKILDE